MATAKPVIKTPTTIEEFRRLANAFITGAPFPAGRTVYVVASTAGLRPIQVMIDAKSSRAAEDVAAALAVRTPPGFTNDEAAHRVVYELDVPETDDLSDIEWPPICHGLTYLFEARVSGQVPVPTDATLGDVDRIELRITWKEKSVPPSACVLPPTTDAVFLTRGALEAFADPFYGATYGTRYLDEIKARRKR
jgi:acetylornithine deacetylase/succinyl-diaminopimelate desuccinylase-like protein